MFLPEVATGTYVAWQSNLAAQIAAEKPRSKVSGEGTMTTQTPMPMEDLSDHGGQVPWGVAGTIYINIYTHIYIYIYIYIHKHTLLYIYTLVCIYIYAYIFGDDTFLVSNISTRLCKDWKLQLYIPAPSRLDSEVHMFSIV